MDVQSIEDVVLPQVEVLFGMVLDCNRLGTLYYLVPVAFEGLLEKVLIYDIVETSRIGGNRHDKD